MNLIDQLIIGDKASFDDFSASVAKRKIKPPKKKSIKETVPFSNETYDFSAINGELYWEERELEYTLEIMADSPEELEELKSKLSSWLMNVQEEEIHDPYIPNYHFKGTYADMDFEDEEDVEKTTATVKFTAYPYMISNLPKVYEATIAPNSRLSYCMVNESACPVMPILSIENDIKLHVENYEIAVSAGTMTSERLKLPVGVISFEIINANDEETTVKAIFYEEVF